MIDTPISELLAKADKPLLSYEFYPPKTEAGLEALNRVIAALAPTNPAFVTVTYGAGGSTREKTFQVAQALSDAALRPIMPHLTCVGSSRAQLEAIADEIYDKGFRNIMTLRGDPPKGEERFVPPADGLSNARELVELLKNRHPDFCCGVAGYPEAISSDAEIDYLKSKVDAGASFISTQLFFNNSMYYRFVDRCHKAGITVPIIPGVMPALSIKQVNRIASLCGCAFPNPLREALEEVGGEGPVAESIGMKWCLQQIDDLWTAGAPGLHLYILNSTHVVEDPVFIKFLTRLSKPA